MEELTDGYLKWRNLSLGQSEDPHSPSPTSLPQATSCDFTITTIDLYSLAPSMLIRQTADKSVVAALVDTGYLGNAPINPSLAESIKTLELFCIIWLH